jgi:hypothetical protein
MSRHVTAQNADRKYLTRALLAIGVLLGAWLLLAAFLKEPQPSIRGAEILDGIQRYCTEQRLLTNTVTFSELIARGYLPADTLEKFGAADVTVFLKTDGARKFLLDARMPDGSHQTLLSDGSVQQITEDKGPSASQPGTRRPANR